MTANKKAGPDLINDCFAFDGERLLHDEALAILRQRLSPIARVQNTALARAANCFVAETINATRNVPPCDNSAVDGFAYATADYTHAGGYFPILAKSSAGDKSLLPLEPGSACRIFTGAAMPNGADTIAMQEDCESHHQDGLSYVAIPPGLKPGANCRKAGEDVEIGEKIARTDERLTPPLLAAIATQGLARIKTFVPLKVALLSTGDELIRPGKKAGPHQIYDSNHFLIAGLLANLPVKIKDAKILSDDAKTVKARLGELAENHDVILSTGGVSLGEHDHIADALAKIGKRHLWQLAIKPGRPMAFGQIGNTAFFGLPGNPVAAFVCFTLYVRPALIRLAGGNWHEPQRFQAEADFDFPAKKTGRREFWRGSVFTDKDGKTKLKKFDRDGSGLITGLRQSNCLIEIAEDVRSVKRGQTLDFIPYSELGIA